MVLPQSKNRQINVILFSTLFIIFINNNQIDKAAANNFCTSLRICTIRIEC